MQVDDIDDLLPNDEELVRRENMFLSLFNKYSIDEAEDAELADMEFSDKLDENEDDDAAGSSFSEASDVEGDDANGSVPAAIDDEMAAKLQPVIQRRMDAWPEKGIQLQLQRVDPRVSVDDWLKANQESTTTTKKYKQVVVNEENKTTTTTTKHTKITTKRLTLHIPTMMAINGTHHQQMLPYNDKCADDNIVTATHTTQDEPISQKKNEPATLIDDAVKVDKLPVTIELSKLSNVVKTKLTKRKPPVTEQLPERADLPAVSSAVIEKSKPATKRRHPRTEETAEAIAKQTTLKTKISPPPVVLPPVDDGNKRCLRSRFKENVALPLPDEKSVVKPTKKTLKTSAARDTKTVNKPPNVVKTTAQKKSQPSKAKSRKEDQQMDLPSTNREPIEKKTDSVHRSRSPLKDKQTNRIEPVQRLGEVRVNLKRLPDAAVTARRSARQRKVAIEQPAPEVTDDTAATRQLSILDVQAIEIADETTQPQKTLKENERRLRPRKTLKENERRGQPRKTVKETERRLRPRKALNEDTQRSAKASKENDDQLAGHRVPAIEDRNTTTQTSNVRQQDPANRSIQMKNLLQSMIVIHSPSSDTILGTKINDTMMLVTQRDYKKCINPKYARNTSIFKRNIIPIDRRIVFQPPMLNVTTDDTTDNDSECEDVLMTSYMHTGRFVQMKA